MDEQKSLAIVDGGGYYLAPATDLNTVLRAYQLKKDIISNVLKEGTDYGKIPGAGDKPALMKPGAEKFANIFGLAPRFEDVETIEDWTGEEHGGEPFFYYRQKCYLYRGEKMVGSADGSCNSWEKKYRYRNADRVCPDCGRNTLRKSKPPKTGYYCWTKIGGCGGNYADNDQRITGQEVGQVKNPDVAEQVNTILKMAQKRALVAAVLITTGASDYFTQDIEDLTYITEEPPLEGEWKPQPPAGTNGKSAAESFAAEAGAVVSSLTLETAENVKNSKGVRYGDLDSEALSNMTIGIDKALKNPATDHEHADELRMKRDAIRLILASRVTATGEDAQ